MFVISFLLSINFIQRIACDQCAPCFCCGNLCINCMRKNLNEIPTFDLNLTKTVKTLILLHNHITTLTDGIFMNYANLEMLYLNDNNISTISRESFTGLRRLRRLDLNNNKLQVLKVHMFQDLEMLEGLFLQGNEITDIPNSTFLGLRRLKILYLFSNRIQSLHTETFRHLEILETLWLTGNWINEISEDTFSGLRTLKKLYLDYNRIKILRPRTFRHQETLEELWLRNNNISMLVGNTWTGLVRLKTLILNNNRLQHICAETFSNLLSLENLYLSGNQILSIAPKSFLNIKNLRLLQLKNMGMKEIPEALWGPRFYNTLIAIKENPFQCSCKLRNDVNQLSFKAYKLDYSLNDFEKHCENITTVCEEERNFALGMFIDSTCYRNKHISFYNIADGNYNSFGTCTQAVNPCKFYLYINLPGDIVVRNVTVKMQYQKLGVPKTASIVAIEIGDIISDRYEQCNNFTVPAYSGIKFSDNDCATAPAGRNARIRIISEDCPRFAMFKFYEVVVKGYDQNKYNLWSSWGEWSACSTTCDNGQRKRSRQCDYATSLECLLPNTNNQRSHIDDDKEICNLRPCFRVVYQWTIGGVCGVFILTVFGIIFWYRKFKMITYFDGLRPNPNFVMDPDRTLLEQIEELPYDLHWEFPRYDVRFGPVLGEGHFGRVSLAKAKGIKAFNPRDKSDLSSRAKLAKLQDQRVHDYFTTVTEAWVLGDCDSTHHYEVAVKTLKECATRKHEMDLANEIKLLIYMGRHPSIVDILASCTIRGDLWLILEYCDHGCLKIFLSDRRHTFTPAWSKQSVDISMEICFFDLLCMCEQIAKGMMFLSSWQVVHRDISARNILVDANFNLKIADFGLARSDGFTASPDDIMPIRWSALESLLRNEYSLKSDMWSVGVLYWEIFSLGEVPYPGMSSRDVVQQLKAGYRMDPPNNCPSEVWAIVLDCWHANPELRPNATELFEQLDEVKVTVCAAPAGQYYGTSSGEYDKAGTVQGPSLKMILDSKENMGFEDEDVSVSTPSGTQKEADKMSGSEPSMVLPDKYRDLETDNSILQNALSNSNKRIYQHEEKETKIKHIIETMDLQDENVRKIKSILLFEIAIDKNTGTSCQNFQMTDTKIDWNPAKDDEDMDTNADTVC